MPPCQEDSKSFFEKLQNAEDLDLRDNRGKRHDLAVILVGVTDCCGIESRWLFVKHSSAFGQSL